MHYKGVFCTISLSQCIVCFGGKWYRLYLLPTWCVVILFIMTTWWSKVQYRTTSGFGYVFRPWHVKKNSWYQSVNTVLVFSYKSQTFVIVDTKKACVQILNSSIYKKRKEIRFIKSLYFKDILHIYIYIYIN